MFVESINVVKSLLDEVKHEKLIKQWELPYENLLTRLDAAIFFVDLSAKNKNQLMAYFDAYPNFKLKDNESALSNFPYQMTFKTEPK